jgi:hypothetical protein
MMVQRRSILELVGKADAKPLVEPNTSSNIAKLEVARGGLQHFQHSRSPNGLATSFENALIAFKLLNVKCRYDVFHDRVHVTNLDEVATSESFDGFDKIALLLRREVLLRWGFDPGKQYIEEALRLECLEHSYDPVREYLDGLKWDGVPRIDQWLMHYCDAADTPLNRAFGRSRAKASPRCSRS